MGGGDQGGRVCVVMGIEVGWCGLVTFSVGRRGRGGVRRRTEEGGEDEKTDRGGGGMETVRGSPPQL